MAIKGKGKAKAKSRQVSRAPRREPVAVKKPFAQRGWVRGLVFFMCGVLVLSVTWWAYEGIDKQRNASKAADEQAQQHEAVNAWKANLEGTLASVGQVQGGASPQIATDVATAITNLGKKQDAGVTADQLTTEADNLEKAAKTLAGFKLTDTIENHGFDPTETDLITTIQPEITAGLRSLAVAARLTAMAIDDPANADALLADAKTANTTGQDLIERGWASYVNIATLAGLPPPIQQPTGAVGGLPQGLGG
jgi:isochorismate synthase EntC